MVRDKAAPSAPRAAASQAAGPCPACGRVADPAAGPLNFCPECGTDLRVGPPPSAAAALAGTVIADRYRLLSLLGVGGMGSVHKAEHIRMGKALALKLLRGDFAREPGAVERFRAEARIVSRLSHPHTIAVFDFGEIDDGSGFYLAMEYVPGKDLAAVLRDRGALPETRAVELGEQILGSLAEAHDAGVVHRDVKPGNVMLMQTRSGEDFVKVLDFGIAKLRDDPRGAGDASTTSAGAIVGTPNYLAPEQARGDAVDGRADLYAVGCLLHELVTGKPPFQAPTPMAVVSAHLQAPVPRADTVPGVSRRFADVLARALAKRPEDRFSSADAMRDALVAAREGAGVRPLARPASPSVTGKLEIARREDFDEFERHVRALRRSRVLAPVTALALVAGAAAAAWRWDDVFSLLAARAPSIAARIPASLRPSGVADGAEHEPNDVPARANPLSLPPGADGRPAGGIAVVRGYVGAKLSDTSGDVDLYRLEVPPGVGRKVLVARWRGERDGEGIRGLDVALALNRERSTDEPRTSAPLVASANRGGPGRPETLVAAVEPGAYYLSVREQHGDATGPVEKPSDGYVLEVRLADPEAGEEVEPNDAPPRGSARYERYPAWRAVAERNPLAEGAPVHGDTSADDPDVYAVAIDLRGGPAGALVAAIPAPRVALSARRWVPDAEDLGPARPQDRVRLEPAGDDGGPGEVLLVDVPAARAPVLVELRAAEGEGRYDVVALGERAASAEAVLALVRALAEGGRPAAALELAAGFATRVPHAARRAEVLRAAGQLALALAPGLTPETAHAHDRAAVLAGAALFEVGADGKVAYTGALEALAR